MKTGNICLVFLLVLNIAHAQTRQTFRNVDVLLFPEFYNAQPEHKGDTTFKYECYDEHDYLIKTDTLHNTDAIEEIFYVKSFFDRRLPGGPGISAPYLTKKLVVYNKVALYTWAVTNVATHNTTELKGYINTIIKQDTTINTAGTDGKLTVRKYYKVAEVPENQRHAIMHKH